MPSPGRAFADWDAPLWTVDDMIGQTSDAVHDNLINDYVWGSSLWPTPITLPYDWLVQPLAWRPIPPVNSQTVSRSGAGSAYATNATSVGEYGTFDPGGVALETALDADPLALAVHQTAWQPNFLQRPPVLTFDLAERTETEQWQILAVVEGSRVILSGTPTTWPAECVSVFVDGIAHEISVDARRVAFTCSPLIGQAAGQVGPWFSADRSLTGGTDVSPF